MNEQIKAKWIEALRGNEYKQGRNALNIDGNMCCLGVLCDLYRKEHPNGPDWNFKIPTERDFVLESVRRKELGFFEHEPNIPPESVLEWAGLQDANPWVHVDVKTNVPDHTEPTTLASLNDSGEFSFSQIADVINHFL